MHCSHFVEHIPMCYVSVEEMRDREAEIRRAVSAGDPRANVPPEYALYRQVPRDDRDRDLLFAFFDECWRVLKPGAPMTVIVPCGRHSRAFQDPTHRRFIVAETWLYLSRGFREGNRLSHYTCECDFDHVVTGLGIDGLEMVRHPEVQAQRFSTLWNVIQDFRIDLKTRKP